MNDGPFVVRVAERADDVAIAGLRWRWSAEENGAVPRMTRERYVEAFASWADSHRGTHTGFVAVRDELIVGMTWLALTSRFPTPQSIERRTADLQSVYVVPEARGAGIGAALVRAALDRAAQDGAERAVVHSSDGAVPLYERAGFASSRRLLDRDL